MNFNTGETFGRNPELLASGKIRRNLIKAGKGILGKTLVEIPGISLSPTESLGKITRKYPGEIPGKLLEKSWENTKMNCENSLKIYPRRNSKKNSTTSEKYLGRNSCRNLDINSGKQQKIIGRNLGGAFEKIVHDEKLQEKPGIL